MMIIRKKNIMEKSFHTKATLATLLLALGTTASLQAVPRTVFLEEFDHYGDYIESFNDGAYVSESPASLKALQLRPKDGKALQARKTYFEIRTAPKSKRYAFTFAFKFYNGKTPCALDLDLFFENKGKVSKHTVHLAETGSRLWDGKAPAPPADGAPGFLRGWDQWNNATLAFDGDKVTLHAYRNGISRLEASGATPKGKLVGYNFTSYDSLAIDSVRITDDATAEDPYAIDEYLKRNKLLAVQPKQTYPANVSLGKGDFSSVRISYFTSEGTRTKGDDIVLTLADGSKRTIQVSAENQTASYPTSLYDAKAKAFVQKNDNKVTITNGILTLYEKNSHQTCREKLFPRTQGRYEPRELNIVVAHRDLFPKATAYCPEIRIVKDAGSNDFDLWLDSKYALHVPNKQAITAISFELAEGSKPGPVVVTPAGKKDFYLPLGVSGLHRPFGTMSGPVRFDAKAAGVPIEVVDDPKNALNLALCRENLGSYWLECNGYLERTPFDGMPSSMHFGIPRAQYIRAYALCAIDPAAPADFIPRVTARLTKFDGGSGRSQAILDVPVDLPADSKQPLPENIKLVGKVGKQPLYLVAFDFDAGAIQDVLAMKGGSCDRIQDLDFELLGPTFMKDCFYLSRKRSPDYVVFSAVQVFGATLERSPVSFVAMPNHTNSTYYPNEQAGFRFTAKPDDDRAYTVTCTVKDLNGKVLETQKDTFKGEREHTFDFHQKTTGNYPVNLTIAGPDGKAIISHDASFSLIPADTRKAGYESPYFMWNFQGAHGTISDINIWGEIAHRAGVRKTMLKPDQAETNDIVKKFMLTAAVIQGAPHLPAGLSDAERDAAYEKHFRDMKARYPHVDTAMFFHESGNGPFPLELLGGKTKVTDDVRKRDANRVRQALPAAKVWKKIDPKMKIILGNSDISLGLIAQLFRAGYPKDCIDKMGDESVGMSKPPEISTAYPAWMLRRLADIYGYKDAKPDACYEWKSRLMRNHRPMEIAAWAVRDALIAHAWNYELIPFPEYTEMANSYYDTVWGCYSMFSRWPLAYPNPTFNACETLTRVLDRASFVRTIPTGSATAYCLEFKKPENGGFIYSFWTPRGVADATLDLGPNKSYTKIGMLGEETKDVHDMKLAVSDEPVYVETAKPIKGVAVAMTRRYPHEETPMAEKAPVAVPLVKAAEVVPVTDHDPRIEDKTMDPPQLSFFVPGKAVVRDAVDDERGPCVEIELTAGEDNHSPEFNQDYVFLKMPGTKPVEGEPDTIGVWVKGNSSWGKLFFELTDAEGEVWISAGTGGYGCQNYDWPQQASINFDGWHFVQFPITGKSPVKVHSPGENQWQWQRDGNGGNGRIDYPVRVSGLGVSTRQRVLVINHMEDTKPVIRLQGIRAF